MTKHIAALMLALAAGAACAAPFRDGDRVVFLGDSITHHGRYWQFVNLFYATRFPERDVWISGSGESGGSAWGAMNRLEADVVAKRPTVVAVMFGMNDGWDFARRRGEVWEGRQAKMDSAFARYRDNMTALVKAIREKAGNPEIIRITPSPYEENCLIGGKASDVLRNEGLTIFSQWVRDEAKKDGGLVVDLNRTLTDLDYREQMKDPCWSFMRGGGTNDFDRIHPSAFGHTLFAYVFLKAQGATGEVASVAIDAKSGPAVRTRNAEISDLEFSGGVMTFSLLEKALPYPLEGECAEAAECVPFVEELDRELFEVKGLAEGAWNLSIDGKSVGLWTADELAGGINLATVRETPQYAQALKVAELCNAAWEKDVTVQNVRMWRLWKTAKGDVPVNDMAEYRKWFAKTYPDGAAGFFGMMAKAYLDNAERESDIWNEAESLKKAARAAAAPVRRRWTLSRAD